MAVIGRIHRLGAALNDELRVVFDQAGLSDGDFDILASLRRAGSPYSLSPGQLAQTTMVSSGAITKRVDRLIERGLVERSVSDLDARGRRVALTPAGLALVNDLVVAHLANEERLLAGFTHAERAQLTSLLRSWCERLDA